MTGIFLETKNIMGGLLLLSSLDKVAKEKDELRDPNSHLQHHINDLIASRCALEESLSSIPTGLKLPKNQMQNLIS